MEKTPIRTDIFKYDAAFRAFKKTATEYERGCLLNHTFLKSLQDQGLFNRQSPTCLIGDIGCGEGDAVVKYLQDIDFKAGLEIRAMDNNLDFIGNGTSFHQKSPAAENLSRAKQSQIIPLKKFEIKFGDLTKSNITQVMCTDEEIQQPINPFDLIYFSHTLYYARQQHENGKYGITYVLDSIASDLLSNNGVAILFHSCLEEDSFMSVSHFSRGMIKDLIPSEEEYQKYSVDALVRSSCSELGLKCYDIPYSYGLYFSKNFLKYRDIFKDPSRYNELLDSKDALQDFHRMMFMPQRSVDDLCADKSGEGLNQVVDNIIDLVEKYGCVKLFAKMQIILGRQASKELKEKVEVAVDACRNKIA